MSRRQYCRISLTRLTIAVCALLGFARASAQRYPFFNIGIEQGLVQSQVFKLLQDSAGHLWAATLGGLSCYDGKEFRSFTMRDGLPSNVITTLCCDKKGNVCIGTNRGLSIYDGHKFHNYTFAEPESGKGNAVSQLCVAADGAIWCIASQQLFSFAAGRIIPIKTPVPARRNLALATIGSDIWISVVNGQSLYRYHPGGWDSLALPDNLQYVYRIFEDAEQRPIIITPAGLYQYDGSNWTPLYKRSSGKEPLIYSFCQASDRSFWLGTTVGAVRISAEGTQTFTRQNGLSDLLIYDLLRDKENNIWIATNGEGIYRFSGAAFTSVDEHMGLTAPQVSSIAQEANGTVYFGTFDGGLFRYRDGRATQVPFPGIPVHVPVSSLELRGNTLWIATQNFGLWLYDVASHNMRRYNDARIGPVVLQLTQDTAGMWIGNGKSIFLASHDSLHELPITGMVEAFSLIGRDSLVAMTAERLTLYSHGAAVPFKTRTAVDSGQVVCMTMGNGLLWIGTSDNGLFGYQLNTGNSVHITRKDGLRSDFIYNVYAPPDGTVWVGTGYGICHITFRDARPVVKFYGRNAGITGMESNKNAVLPLADGSIWFGTTGGAVLYHPQNTLAVTRPVSLQLQHLAVFGEPVSDSSWFHGTTPFYSIPKNLRLPYRKNSLNFSFSAVSLTGEENIKYRYRLEGASAPWSEWSATNTVTFSTLPPGHYELLVQCTTDGMHPQSQMLRYPFEIITPFHKTNLFRFLIIVGCIILGVGLQYLAARRKRLRLAQLEAVRREEQAKVRQRTAEDFHDEVGNKLTRINVLTNVLRAKVGAAPDATRLIDQIQDNAGQLYSGTRDILWSLQPSNDNLYQVMNRVRDFGRDLFGDTDTNFEMEDISPTWKEYRLPMDASRNLIMIFKEALNNVLKYSGATRVIITSIMQGDNLAIVLHDNGEGFDPTAARRGQGINNMNTRATRLGGTLKLESSPKRGTSITLELKIPQNTGLRIATNTRNL